MAYKMLYLARRAKDVAWEDWPRTWKSHAIFASQFPAMDGTIDWMRYTTRIDDPALGELPVSTAHDGVSVAEAQVLDTFLGKGFTREQRDLIDIDELRVFDRYTPDFSFYCRESRPVPGPLGEAAVFRFLKRRDGVSKVDFEAALTGRHGDACVANAGALGVSRWALNMSIGDVHPDFPFEAIDESWFARPEDAAKALRAPEMAAVVAGLEGVCEPGTMVTMLTRPTHRWPREPRPA